MPTVLCCDNCLRKRGDSNQTALSETEATLLALITRIESRPPPPPPQPYSSDAKRRWKDRRKAILEDLKVWRLEVWSEKFPYAIFPPEVLLSDSMAANLATNACIKSLDDLQIAYPYWSWLGKLGTLLLLRIEATDTAWLANRAQEIEVRKRERMEKAAAERALKAAETEAKRIEKMGIRDPPGTVLAYDPMEHQFVREDGTVQPKMNEVGPVLSTLSTSDDTHYLEFALLDSLSDPTVREIVQLNTCSLVPLQDEPKATPAVKIKKAVKDLITARHPPAPKKKKAPAKKKTPAKRKPRKKKAKDPGDQEPESADAAACLGEGSDLSLVPTLLTFFFQSPTKQVILEPTQSLTSPQVLCLPSQDQNHDLEDALQLSLQISMMHTHRYLKLKRQAPVQSLMKPRLQSYRHTTHEAQLDVKALCSDHQLRQ